MVRARAILVLASAAIWSTQAFPTLAAGNGNSGGSGGAHCQTAAGLTILQPNSSSLTAAGDLTLYCPGTGSNGRNGETGQGTPAEVLTGACTIDTGWEEAQLIGQAIEITPAGGAGRLEAFPIAFWSGTTGGEFATDTDTFYSGSDSVTVPGGNWSSRLSPYPPAPPAYLIGKGLANGLYVFSGIDDDVVDVKVTSDPATPGTWDNGLCHDPGVLTVKATTVPARNPGPGAPPVPPFSVPATEAQALAQLTVNAGKVETDAPDNYVVFAPTCFWVAPQPEGADVAPTIDDLMGAPDSQGVSIVYSFYLSVAPSDSVHWNFGDGTGEDVPALSSGSCVTHYYTQISGEGSIPAAGATVTADQDVSVTAFVGWVGGSGSASYECVRPGGGLGGTVLTTQAEAESSCSQAFAGALVDTPLPPKPIYQIRAIPVA
jgi:hypothetical protein